MKILRFNDDRVGVIKNDNMVVDVSDATSSRKAKGPQRVIEEIIEGWRKDYHYEDYARHLEAVATSHPAAGAMAQETGGSDSKPNKGKKKAKPAKPAKTARKAAVKASAEAPKKARPVIHEDEEDEDEENVELPGLDEEDDEEE